MSISEISNRLDYSNVVFYLNMRIALNILGIGSGNILKWIIFY